MAYNDLKDETQRDQVVIVQIDLDINDPEFDAEFAADLSSYGTPKTTNDIRAYLEGNVKTYSFCNQLIYGLDCLPGLESATSEPPVLNPGVDIGVRATGKIKLKDFISSDSFELTGLYNNRRVDGSFWAKLLARNELRYRPARILRGYAPDGYFDILNFEVEHFVIDAYQGPSLSADIDIDVVDVLTFTDALNVKVPFVTTGILAASITNSQTTMTFNALDTAEEYGTSGFCALGSEIIGYTITSPTSATITRGQFGSVASEHAINASIQRCLVWDNVNAIDILYDIFALTDVPANYIPTVKWDALKAGPLNIYNLRAVLYKSEEVKKLINEIIEHCNLTMFVDVVAKEITIIPGGIVDNPVITFDCNTHINENTFTWSNQFSKFVTNQFIRWALKDYTKTEITNYTKNKRTANLLSESPRKFKVGSAGKDIISRWLPNTLDGNQIADQIVTRKVNQYGSDIPKQIKFNLDNAYVGDLGEGKRFWLGSIFQIIPPTNCLINANATEQNLVAQCISLKRGEADNWQVTGLTYTANFPDESDYIIPAGTYLNYNLANDPEFVSILSAGGAKNYVVIIQTGTLFGSTSISTAAFIQGTFPAGATLTLINYGRILGKGGNGGNGGGRVNEGGEIVLYTPTDGTDGGPALSLSTDTDIDNLYGLIGGGGGGAGGRSYNNPTDPSSRAGKGGGGGQGSQPGIGGDGGLDEWQGFNGDDGQDASIDSPGLGYPAGGYLGENGQDGELIVGTSGGVAGPAILTNGNTVNITAGNSTDKIKGAII